ncbi:MAG: hypothetical protein JOZ19_02950 [Rubrobacter sp.]|nr:hypothetical protein [Rubrobacter sp.]
MIAGTAHIPGYSQGGESLGGEASLLDSDGSALVIHAGDEAQITDPAGGSGSRIVCEVLQG